jgi:signal transduction histidine kinase
MGLRDWTFLVAAVGHLALALLSTARAGKSPLALPTALLAFDFFGWTFATFCHHRLDSPLWRALDVIFTAVGPAVVLHVVLAFVGKLRARRAILRAAYVAFGALALSSTPAFFVAWDGWIESTAWAALFLAAWIPTLVYELVVLVSHLRAATDADEQARSRLVLAALVVGGAFASTDLWNDVGGHLPALTPLGTLVSTSLLAIVALKLRLFDRNPGGAMTLYAASLAIAAVLVYLTLFQGLRGNLPALTFGVTVVTLVLTAVVREATGALSAYRERVERLAVLGRFSAQMAHDLKNPLAALLGAVQVLDAPEGATSPEDARTFRAMIVEQAYRIRTIVEQYDRLGRVEPVVARVAVNDLVGRAVALPPRATGGAVTLTLDLDSSVADAEIDPDLVTGALENILRNALDAMPGGGALVVRTRREHRDDGGDSVVITVKDSGEGMDARQAERAFDDFYTTKSAGSGLGLAFVRRVAIAHGGDASLVSKRGVGTTVAIRLPLPRA